MNKLSFSSVNLYNQCSYCYYLKYIEKIYPKRIKSSLLFGTAIDKALNHLLLEKNLEAAKQVFIDNWTTGKINYKPVQLEGSDLIIYSKSDLDLEFLKHSTKTKPKDLNWSSLYFKGLLFIKAYYEKVLPRIKNVISIQESISIKNHEGDQIAGNMDIIVEWEDGKRYLLDNKTTTYKYEAKDAQESPQLNLYDYIIHDKYKLDGIGFIVLNKKINKNKVKKCKSCEAINNSSHKTCNQELPIIGPLKRCNGEFEITINPSVDIDFIFDKIDPNIQNKVIENFDETNNKIANKEFNMEHNPIRGKYGFCDYKEYYEGNEEFIRMAKKESKD